MSSDALVTPRSDRTFFTFNALLSVVAVAFIALKTGYEASPTPEGVSRATTRTVVSASLAVLGLDFILTALMFSGS